MTEEYWFAKAIEAQVMQHKMADRIAELEAELANAHALHQHQWERAEKAEAEVDRLKDYLVRVGFSRKTADDVASYEGSGRESEGKAPAAKSSTSQGAGGPVESDYLQPSAANPAARKERDG